MLHSDGLTGKPFRSIVVAVEKCVNTETITCANDTEVDHYFEDHPIKLKTGFLKFGRDVFAESANIENYIDPAYDQDYVPISSGFRDWSTTFLNNEKYKR